jgi:hypothetical protein
MPLATPLEKLTSAELETTTELEDDITLDVEEDFEEERVVIEVDL